MEKIARQLAEIALDIEAIKLSPRQPFTWASGYRMPIYNDNRRLLGNYEHRAFVAAGFAQALRELDLNPEVIAGTATAGIPHGTSLADLLKLPFIYVRDKAKGHGLQNRIEGILHANQRVVMIEDLLSTGGSSASAVTAVREGGGVIDTCLSIFSYGLDECLKQFDFINCQCFPLLTFDVLLEVALERGYIHPDDLREIREWRSAPLEWGEKRGFPKIEK